MAQFVSKEGGAQTRAVRNPVLVLFSAYLGLHIKHILSTFRPVQETSSSGTPPGPDMQQKAHQSEPLQLGRPQKPKSRSQSSLSAPKNRAVVI